MRKKFRACLELLRVFLTPTAVSDSLAGFIVAGALGDASETAPPARAALVAGASVCAYWLGMAANDLFDRDTDARRAPGKPIPSGRISEREATALCFLLGAMALALAFACGALGLMAGLVAAILAYDAGGKNIPVLGNVLMGLCRAGNFLLGAVAARGQIFVFETPALFWGGATLCLFIMLVTAVSRLEDEPFNVQKLRWRAAWTLLIPLGLYLARWTDIFSAVNSLAFAALLLGALRKASAAGINGRGHFHGAAVFVRESLAGIFLLDAGLALAILPDSASRAPVVVIFYALLGLGWLWKREWLQRGSPGS